MDKIAAYEILLSSHPLWTGGVLVKEAVDADELMDKVRKANKVNIGDHGPDRMFYTEPTRRQYPIMAEQDARVRQLKKTVDRLDRVQKSPVLQKINKKYPDAGKTVAGLKTVTELALQDRTRVPHKSSAGQIFIDPTRIGKVVGGGKMSPEGERALAGVFASHELAERKVRPSNIQTLSTHLAPEVLLKERNAVARLTGAGADEARKAVTDMRYRTGEADWMKNLLTDQYGPRAAQFLEGNEKVPKAMLRNLRKKIQQNPEIVDKAEPFTRMGGLERLKRMGPLLADKARFIKGKLP